MLQVFHATFALAIINIHLNGARLEHARAYALSFFLSLLSLIMIEIDTIYIFKGNFDQL